MTRKICVAVSPLLLAFLIYFRLTHKFTTGMERPLIVFGVAISSSILLTPLVRKLSFYINALDIPNERKIHKEPTALLGGLAVFISLIIALFVNGDFSYKLRGIIYGATLVCAVGAIDDLRGNLSSGLRLLIQIAASVIVIRYGVVIHLFVYSVYGRILSTILTVIWLVGITNSINFLDGMDGLATGLSAIASGIFFIIAYQINNPYLGFISIAICGASAGFLIHNFKPARIFLGDAGSTTLGFTLAAFGVMGDWSNGNPFISFGIPVLIMGIPIFDMTYTTIERFSSGKVHTFSELLAYAGKDHFHHRLSNLGLSDQQTVFFIYFVGLTLGISAVVLEKTTVVNMVLTLIQAACIFLIITIIMRFGSKKADS